MFQYIGSPPRVRGEVRRGPAAVRCDGITPACAGRRCCGPARCPSGLDHPRVCGEKFLIAFRTSVATGSPPRARGEVQSQREEKIEVGITPACAGRSVLAGLRPRSLPDHPRVCGEKPVTVGYMYYLKDHPRVCGEKWKLHPEPESDFGSPPRVRGEVAGQRVDLDAARITPACAGRSGIF